MQLVNSPIRNWLTSSMLLLAIATLPVPSPTAEPRIFCLTRAQAEACLVCTQESKTQQQRLKEGCGGNGEPPHLSFWSTTVGQIALILIGAGTFKVGEDLLNHR